ncbi:MAG: hypothetical protein ACRDYY_05710 [Acidimicrobiales bacterium]
MAITRQMVRPVVFQSMRTSRHSAVLSTVVASQADQVLEVAGEPGPYPGERDPLGACPVGGTVEPSQFGPDLESPAPEVEVAPDREHRADVIAGLGETALGTVQPSGAQLHRDRHSRRLEGDLGRSLFEPLVRGAVSWTGDPGLKRR